jgi:hypothetical protein
VERADQVLALVDVDRGLPAHRGVGHAEQRGRDQDDLDAAQPGRGDEAGQVGGRSPADADDAVRPGHVVPREPGPQARRDRSGLGRLAVGHGLGVDLVAGRGERAAGRAGDLAEALGVDDHHGAGAVGDQAGQLAEHADPDDHLVRPAAVGRRDVDPGSGHFCVISAAI